MQFRLMMNRDQLDRCRKGGRDVTRQLQKFIDRHTSTAVEQAIVRMLGVTGLHRGKPLTQCVVELLGADRLRDGAAYWLGAIMVQEKCTAEAAALALVKKGSAPASNQGFPHAEIRRVTRHALDPYAKQVQAAAHARPNARRRNQCRLLASHQSTGDLAEDVRTIKAAQHEPFAGLTFRLPLAPDGSEWIGKGKGWRSKYDLSAAISQCTQAAGTHPAADTPFTLTFGGLNLLAPELGTLLATTSVAAIEYDALSAAKIDGVHVKRALIDQHFLYRLCARANMNVAIRSHEWNRCVDGYERGHELLLGQIVLEAMGAAAGLELDAMRPQHTLMLATADHVAREERIAYELAHAQLLREIFPQVTAGFVTDGTAEEVHLGALLAAVCDYQHVVVPLHINHKSVLGWTKDALHKLDQLIRWSGSLCDDISFVSHGKIGRRGLTLLERMEKLAIKLGQHDLLQLNRPSEQISLFEFTDGGAGLDGVVQKNKHYWNPVESWLCPVSASS